MIQPSIQRYFKNPVLLIACGFGAGLSKWMPGTIGTIAAIPIFILLSPLPVWIYLTLSLFLFLMGVFICQKASDVLNVQDAPQIVFDEIVGYLLTMTAVPCTLPWIFLGLLSFRLFDIWKPYPIRWVDQKIKGGFGIMLDDLVAAIAAWMLLQGLLWGLRS